MKQTTKSSSSSSFHGATITSSVEELKRVLGDPEKSSNSGEDKTNFDWTLETSNGEIITVYDWKEYRTISETELICFHIGGFSQSATIDAAKEIQSLIKS